MPEAVTLNVTLEPTAALRLAGWVVMVGAVTVLTVSVAVAEVTAPAEFETVTL